MVGQFTNLLELTKYFSTEKICVEYLEQQLWNGEPTCPHCLALKPYRTATRSRKAELVGTFDYKCSNKTCHKKFTAITGTIFENTKIDLKTWFAAIYLCTAHKKGVSSCQIARDLGITQKSAWFVLHRIREMLRVDMPDMIENVAFLDETYVGGKNKNRHADKKIEGSQGRSSKDKTPVLGAIGLEGKIQLAVVPNTQAETLRPIVEKWVKEGAIMVTDEWRAYSPLQDKYFHVVVNHSGGEYVRGAFSTNNVENFWSLFKRGIYGIYHQVSPKHLQRYCEEFALRFNTRKIKDANRFEYSVSKSKGRLKYKDLIGSGE